MDNRQFQCEYGSQQYFYLSLMKSKRHEQPAILDIKGLGELHGNIINQIGQLDKLNQEFKVKQEHHFLKTFMGVLERMGNDLILAQEAYRNIDIEIKREKYYQEIATQLTFFKGECFVLKKENLQLKQKIQSLELDQETSLNEIASLKNSYARKCNEASQMKEKMSVLRKKLRADLLIDKSQPKFTTPERNNRFAGPEDSQDELFEKRNDVAQRWVQAQQLRRKRIGGQSSQGLENTPHAEQQKSSRYNASAGSKYRSTYHSSFQRQSKEKGKRSDGHLFD